MIVCREEDALWYCLSVWWLIIVVSFTGFALTQEAQLWQCLQCSFYEGLTGKWRPISAPLHRLGRGPDTKGKEHKLNIFYSFSSFPSLPSFFWKWGDLYMLCKCSTTEPQPQPLNMFSEDSFIRYMEIHILKSWFEIFCIKIAIYLFPYVDFISHIYNFPIELVLKF